MDYFIEEDVGAGDEAIPGVTSWSSAMVVPDKLISQDKNNELPEVAFEIEFVYGYKNDNCV